ncbi:hypothetical protein CFP59_08714 [Streptomyces malaysiensis subsp. malaysiensis]|nr:hypothetical protein CFP59_08714 [Streptomyces sp. M56]
MFQRLQADGFFARTAIIAGRGMDFMRLPVPVRPGDVLHGELQIKGIWAA